MDKRRSMTQQEKIVAYMERHGSITPYEAFAELRITKLATRISELIKDGIQIDKERVVKRDADGAVIQYTKYRLQQETGC